MARKCGGNANLTTRGPRPNPRQMARDVCITVDLEHDCPPFLASYRGVTDAMPRLLTLLDEERVPATFFTTGDVARRYPDIVRRLVAAGHELGCHGDTHVRFSTLDRAAARSEIAAATTTLRSFAEVVSFRAPNLDLPLRHLDLLAAAGYRVDSSCGRHKPGSFFVAPSTVGALRRVPASIPPSALRLPGPLHDAVCRTLSSPAVLFFHPWEFIDVTREPIPLSCRYRTGEPALASLRATLRWFRRRGAAFRRLRELATPAAA